LNRQDAKGGELEMPSVKKGESEKKYVDRAIPAIIREHPGMKGDHAAAIAHGMYRESKGKKR